MDEKVKSLVFYDDEYEQSQYRSWRAVLSHPSNKLLEIESDIQEYRIVGLSMKYSVENLGDKEPSRFIIKNIITNEEFSIEESSKLFSNIWAAIIPTGYTGYGMEIGIPVVKLNDLIVFNLTKPVELNNAFVRIRESFENV